MQITRDQLRLIQADLMPLFTAIGRKHGVLMSISGASFPKDAEAMAFTVVVQPSGTPATGVQRGEWQVGEIDARDPKDVKAEQDYIVLCQQFGLKKEWLGQWFTSGSSQLKVAGLYPNRDVNCVAVRGRKGGHWIMPAAAVISAFNRGVR